MITKNDRETRRAGELLAQEIKKTPLVIALEGDLGAGKTTFIQGIAKGLGIQEQITSPTFVIMKKYPINGGFFYHLDCYRLNS
ncbi:MAG: tRNA (adenosine(37)-N6)-threonylcarbamoyltransferase complex ATPase subunit type 1 TsaE, partial [bacterium]